MDGKTHTKMGLRPSYIRNGKTSPEIGSSLGLFGKHPAVLCVDISRAQRPGGCLKFTTHACDEMWRCRTKDQMYTYVMADGDEEERVVLDLRSGFGRGFYYPSLGKAGKPGWERNPYSGAALNAPFDQVGINCSCASVRHDEF